MFQRWLPSFSWAAARLGSSMQRIVLALAALFPSLMLLAADGPVYTDWDIARWLTGYTANYFRQRGEMPLVINVMEGNTALPLFYGWLLYPVLGMGSLFLHPEIVLRLAAAGLIILEFALVHATVLALGGSRGVAATAACLVVWAIYPMTNLYHRSAMAEFFATGLLFCSVCLWFQMTLAPTWIDLTFRGLAFGIMMTLSAGSHPITALCMLPVLPTLLLTWRWPTARVGGLSRLSMLTVLVLLSALSLAPWIYVTEQFRPFLKIVAWGDLALFSDSIDWWVCRLLPFPLDVRMLTHHYHDVQSPHLNAPVNGALLMLAAAVAWQRFSRMTSIQQTAVVAPALLACAYLGVSLLGLPNHPALRLLHLIQFGYRLVTYVDLLGLIVLFTSLYAFQDGRESNKLVLRPALLCILLAVSGCAAAVKLWLAFPAQCPPQHEVWTGSLCETDESYKTYRNFPVALAMSNATDDYCTQVMINPLSPEEDEKLVEFPFVLGDGETTGDYLPLVVELKRDSFVLTQPYIFPWGRFFLDGVEIPSHSIRRRPGSPQTIVAVPAGTHRLEYRFEPDNVYLTLSYFSRGALLMWGAGLIFFATIAFWRRCCAPRPS